MPKFLVWRLVHFEHEIEAETAEEAEMLVVERLPYHEWESEQVLEGGADEFESE